MAKCFTMSVGGVRLEGNQHIDCGKVLYHVSGWRPLGRKPTSTVAKCFTMSVGGISAWKETNTSTVAKCFTMSVGGVRLEGNQLWQSALPCQWVASAWKETKTSTVAKCFTMSVGGVHLEGNQDIDGGRVLYHVRVFCSSR